MPSSLEVASGRHRENLGRTPYPCWMTLYSPPFKHFRFKRTKEEILAHLTHFDGTVAAPPQKPCKKTMTSSEEHGIAKAGLWQIRPTK